MSEEILNETTYVEEEPVIRANPFCVISKVTFGDYNIHDIQTNAAWGSNPYGDDYAVVPDEMVPGVMETHGFIDPVFNEEGTELVSYTAREIPEIPEEPVSTEPSANELIDILLGGMTNG